MMMNVLKMGVSALACLAMEGESQKDFQVRCSHYENLSTILEKMNDTELARLIEKAEKLHEGTGGICVKIEIHGVKIFVKLVPLNHEECKSQTTKNLFNIPTFYQYGVGSAGFNTWREVRSHEASTQWVLSGKEVHFPILYHWRLLKKMITPKPMDQEKLTKKIEYWENSPAIGKRLKANHHASNQVALFLEYIPQNLDQWLDEQLHLGGEALERGVKMVEENLISIVQFMNSQDMLHFDAHFWNIVTDGKEIYFTDFGLANRSSFDLSYEEQEFFQHHLTYDRCYVVTHLAYWLISHLFGENQTDEVLATYAQGKTPENLPETVTPYLNSVIARYAPIANVMNGFIRTLRLETKKAPYPAQELEVLWHQSQQREDK